MCIFQLCIFAALGTLILDKSLPTLSHLLADPSNCDFENGLCEDTWHNGGFKGPRQGTTPSSNTGPSGDATTGKL